MKLSTALLLGGVMLGGVIASSFMRRGDEKKTIRITGTRFFYPLVEQWAAAFKKEHPDVEVVVQFGLKDADISMTGTPVDKEDPAKGKYAVVSRFAVVPIINAQNPAWATLQQRGLSKAEVEKIYFKGDEQQSSFPSNNGAAVPIRVYTRGACASATFSSYFGKHINDLTNLDVHIADDDVLLKDVLNDTLGVAYNNLGFVYDLQTRKQKPGIRVVPIDLNGDGEIDSSESFYGDLDQLIATLETKYAGLPPVGKLVFIYKEDRPEVKDFVRWVQTKGPQYDHAFGFLQ